MDKVYIFGHKNPDTDSVCGSISLSYLKNKLGYNSEPRILGSINPETSFALKKFKVNVPLYLNDVKVQIKNINYRQDYIMNENKPIIEAFSFMNENSITGLPLVDDDGKFKGYVSLKEIANDMIYNESLRVETSFDNLASTLEASETIKFDDEITGFAHAATFDDATFIKNIPLDNESILIVGDRNSIIRYAIESKVKLIIIVKNRHIPDNLKEFAKENKVNMIITPKSSFKIARLLCLSNPIKSIQRDSKTITFNVNDYLSDFNEITSKYKHTNYPIINNQNVCLGMLRTIDAHEINKKKVILVDHNMLDQSVDGLYESEILEIIDHHNIGDINTNLPINFRNMAVGSVNTIIYHLYQENNIDIPSNIAGLMLSGIISDTLLLKSPTTTDIDRKVALDLASIAKVDLNKYGLELLESGVDITGLTDEQIIYKDFKTYKVDEKVMAVGQVFTTNFDIFKDRIDSIVEYLNKIDEVYNYRIITLYVTNFLTNDSYLLFSDNSKKSLELAYGVENINEGHFLPGVVSRKKQIIPVLMDVLEHL